MNTHTAHYVTGTWCGWPWIASADTKALPLSFEDQKVEYELVEGQRGRMAGLSHGRPAGRAIILRYC